MTLREGPWRAEQATPGRVSIWHREGNFGLYAATTDLPALRRLLEMLEGREAAARSHETWCICAECEKQRKPAQPTKGKRRRDGRGR